MTMRGPLVAACAVCLSLPFAAGATAGVPQNVTELWAGYDPCKEPLDVQVVREWRDGGIRYRYVLYTIGTFKGHVSRMAGFYAVPEGGGKLPALLHLHGGGQRAFLDEVKFAAQNGYAGLSINWGGRPMEGAQPGEPTTDWGALDATQTGHNSHYASLQPDEKTLDTVESPRNNNWYLLVLAARRAITFLQQQPEVDPARIGVHGHSMGGKLTTQLAGIDGRVKAAVPSCGGGGSAPEAVLAIGGSGVRGSESPLHLRTIDDRAYIPRITCPILMLSPTNDFNCRLDCMFANWADIASPHVRYSISPHLNHRHDERHAVCRLLWFEQWLKGRFTFPDTPKLELKLDAADGVPRAVVTPDASRPIEKVDIYYSIDPHVLTRFWRDAGAVRQGAQWVGTCPLLSVEQPLFVYADVTYSHDLDLKQPRTGEAYERRFALSSRLATVLPKALAAGGAKATDAPAALIEDFSRGWHDWFRLQWPNPVHWEATTRKPKDPKRRGPDGARLALDVKTARDNLLVFEFTFNSWGAFAGGRGGSYAAVRELKGSADWQTVSVGIDELLPSGKTAASARRPANWRQVTELSLRSRVTVLRKADKPELIERSWKGPREFRNLRWERP